MDAGKCAHANQYGTYAPATSLPSKPGWASGGNALEIVLDLDSLLSPQEDKNCKVTAPWPRAAPTQEQTAKFDCFSGMPLLPSWLYLTPQNKTGKIERGEMWHQFPHFANVPCIPLSPERQTLG